MIMPKRILPFPPQVSEFSLADGQSSTSTSLLRSLCHSDDSVILGTRFQDTEEAAIEDQLLANSASGSGAIEHDPCSLFRPRMRGTPTSARTEMENLTQPTTIQSIQPLPHFVIDVVSAPGPLPLGVSVVDQSIIVFGIVFPRAAQKHRLQMLEHFSKLIKDQAKASDSKVCWADCKHGRTPSMLYSLSCRIKIPIRIPWPRLSR